MDGLEGQYSDLIDTKYIIMQFLVSLQIFTISLKQYLHYYDVLTLKTM